MAKASYEIMLQKYNTLVAKAKDLQSQLETKTKQMSKFESGFKVTEELTRELCEMILANDRAEMKLGVDYSWSGIEINKLVTKTKAVYVAYTKDIKEKMGKLLNANEERDKLIVGLEEQVEILRRENGNYTKEELEEKVKKQKEIEELEATVKKGTVYNNTDHQLLSIGMDESDAIEGAEQDMLEAAMIMDADMQSKHIQISKSSAVIKESENRTKKKKKMKEKISDAYYADIAKFENGLDHIHYAILQAIGKKGLSRFQHIEEEVLKDDKIKKHQVRLHTTELSKNTILNVEDVNTSWSRLYVYNLSDLGVKIYKRKFEEDPVLSEAEVIRAEHDNCEHGYGIVLTAEMLRASKNFKEVKEFNRKNPIKISEGSSYIPDIICERKNGSTMYIEYECANHTQADFDAKCNKMCKLTSVINFMTPNIKTEEAICTQVSKWIQNKGAKNMGHITIRVTTIKLASGVDLNKDENWKSVFRPKTSGKTPTTNM